MTMAVSARAQALRDAAARRRLVAQLRDGLLELHRVASGMDLGASPASCHAIAERLDSMKLLVEALKLMHRAVI